VLRWVIVTRKSIYRLFKNFFGCKSSILDKPKYSKNNENVTEITIYSVTSRGYGKTYGKLQNLKLKINK